MSTQHVWVVEMLDPYRLQWKPCADASLSKAAALISKRVWGENYYSDRFRVTKYVRHERGQMEVVS